MTLLCRWLVNDFKHAMSTFVPYDQEETYGLGMGVNVTSWAAM